MAIEAGTILQFDQAGLIVACHNSSLLIRKIQLSGKAEISIKADFFKWSQRLFRRGHNA